jgi:hypothetical protein
VHLEHRQIIARLVQNAGHAQRLFALTVMGARLVAEKGTQLRHIEVAAGTIDEPLEDGIQGRAAGEQEVAAVLDLKGGVAIVKMRVLLLIQIQGEAQCASGSRA